MRRKHATLHVLKFGQTPSYEGSVLAPPPTITGAPSFTYGDGKSAGYAVGTVATTGTPAAAFRFSSTQTATSSDGFFQISSSGVITLTSSGASSVNGSDNAGVNPHAFTHGVQAASADGLWSSVANVTITVYDATAPSANPASFTYGDGKVSGYGAGTVTATDNVGVTQWRFTATQTATSSDGFYQISNAGAITLSATGASNSNGSNNAGVSPHAFTYGVQAGDAAGNWSSSVNVTLTVNDATAPSMGSGQVLAFTPTYAAGAAIGTLAATDNVGVTQWRFAATGTNTSSDGYFQISSGGVVSLTSAGVSSAADNYSATPNSWTYSIQAGDAAGNWSAAQSVTISENPPPVVTQLYHFDAVAGEVSGSTPVAYKEAVSGQFVNMPSGYTNGYELATTNAARVKFGAAAFDYERDYREYPTQAPVKFAGDFTVDYWFWPFDTGFDQIHLARKGDTTAVYGIGYSTATNSLALWNGAAIGSPTIKTSSGTLTSATWGHCAFTRSGSTVYIFYNGVLKATGTVSGTFDLTGALYTLIGNLGNGSTANAMYGYLDELHIKDGACDWTANFTPPTAPYSP